MTGISVTVRVMWRPLPVPSRSPASPSGLPSSNSFSSIFRKTSASQAHPGRRDSAERLPGLTLATSTLAPKAGSPHQVQKSSVSALRLCTLGRRWACDACLRRGDLRPAGGDSGPAPSGAERLGVPSRVDEFDRRCRYPSVGVVREKRRWRFGRFWRRLRSVDMWV